MEEVEIEKVRTLLYIWSCDSKEDGGGEGLQSGALLALRDEASYLQGQDDDHHQGRHQSHQVLQARRPISREVHPKGANKNTKSQDSTSLIPLSGSPGISLE